MLFYAWALYQKNSLKLDTWRGSYAQFLQVSHYSSHFHEFTPKIRKLRAARPCGAPQVVPYRHGRGFCNSGLIVLFYVWALYQKNSLKSDTWRGSYAQFFQVLHYRSHLHEFTPTIRKLRAARPCGAPRVVPYRHRNTGVWARRLSQCTWCPPVMSLTRCWKLTGRYEGSTCVFRPYVFKFFRKFFNIPFFAIQVW